MTSNATQNFQDFYSSVTTVSIKISTTGDNSSQDLDPFSHYTISNLSTSMIICKAKWRRVQPPYCPSSYPGCTTFLRHRQVLNILGIIDQYHYHNDRHCCLLDNSQQDKILLQLPAPPWWQSQLDLLVEGVDVDDCLRWTAFTLSLPSSLVFPCTLVIPPLTHLTFLMSTS